MWDTWDTWARRGQGVCCGWALGCEPWVDRGRACRAVKMVSSKRTKGKRKSTEGRGEGRRAEGTARRRTQTRTRRPSARPSTDTHTLARPLAGGASSPTRSPAARLQLLRPLSRQLATGHWPHVLVLVWGADINIDIDKIDMKCPGMYLSDRSIQTGDGEPHARGAQAKTTVQQGTPTRQLAVHIGRRGRGR